MRESVGGRMGGREHEWMNERECGRVGWREHEWMSERERSVGR